MSYIEQEKRSRPIAIGGVVLLHVVVGYALISGFAITVIQQIPKTFIAEPIPDDPEPPKHEILPPQPKPIAAPDPRPVDTVVKIDIDPGPSITIDPVRPVIDKPPVTPPPPQIASHARNPIPMGSRATWVTNDDYPPAALREEVQGVVAIDVTVGADGRVSACSVTKSSGSDVLDQATCRLYARRGRFQSALDDDGKAAVGHYSDRIRWQIPQ